LRRQGNTPGEHGVEHNVRGSNGKKTLYRFAGKNRGGLWTSSQIHFLVDLGERGGVNGGERGGYPRCTAREIIRGKSENIRRGGPFGRDRREGDEMGRKKGPFEKAQRK